MVLLVMMVMISMMIMMLKMLMIWVFNMMSTNRSSCLLALLRRGLREFATWELSAPSWRFVHHLGGLIFVIFIYTILEVNFIFIVMIIVIALIFMFFPFHNINPTGKL